jgi:lysyl-tRNA synthetase class 2
MWQPTNTVEEDRFNKLQYLHENNIAPYPNRVERTHTTAQAIQEFEAAEAQNPDEPAAVEVTVCGRVVRQNLKGKIYFGHIEDGAGRVQLFIRINSVGDETFAMIKNALDLGDFVQASGTMMRTKMGEVSVNVQEFRLLTKSLSPLPVIKEHKLDDGTVERYGEFSDVEERYRQRYADLAVNPDVRDVFRKRAKTIRSVQNFLDDIGFLEVETPILQPIYGGAAARPFTTHHNQLHQDLFLRISFELYLKRLLVGGFDGVYEIGRDFRNEGVSQKHNPEFTMLELYQAYTDYEGMMNIAENMLVYAAEQVLGTTVTEFRGHTIDFGQTWQRITVRDLIRHHLEIDYEDYPTPASLEAAIRTEGHNLPSDLNRGKLIEFLLDLVEPSLIQPTIVKDYPIDISPFAKKIQGNQTHVERFEFFIGGMELGNAFTELNDPLDQQQRFLEMGRLYANEDDDATPIDEDYLRSMRYGMPPCGGLGVGIDRVVMLFTGRSTIREVLLFPHLRSRE